MRIEDRLNHWGNWKRNCIVNLGYPSDSSYSPVSGDGNIGGGKKKPEVIYKADNEAEKIDSLYIQFAENNPQEMRVLYGVYVLQWPVKKLANEGKSSRHHIKKLLTRGQTLIEGALSK